MGVDVVLLQLAIVFLPGLIWAQIDARHVAKDKPGQVDFVVRVFLFGLATYVVVFVGYRLFGKDFTSLGIDASTQAVIPLNHFVDEIVISIPTSFVLAVLWVYMVTYKILVRFLMLIRATRRYGDEDVWDFMFNSPQIDTEYVYVRDFDKGVTYTGWVRAFSETEKLRELLLVDVILYHRDGGEPTKAPLLYLARDRSDIHIEFPLREKERSRGKGVLRWLTRMKSRITRFFREVAMSSEAD